MIVADDEPLVRRLLCCVLRDQGYDVLEAQDGRELKEHLHHPEVEFVVADLRMPNFNEAESIRELRPELPVIAVTGLAREEALPIAARLGTDLILHKPFQLDDLVDLIEVTLKKRGGG